jgi:hypothetical protein
MSISRDEIVVKSLIDVEAFEYVKYIMRKLKNVLPCMSGIGKGEKRIGSKKIQGISKQLKGN